MEEQATCEFLSLYVGNLKNCSAHKVVFRRLEECPNNLTPFFSAGSLDDSTSPPRSKDEDQVVSRRQGGQLTIIIGSFENFENSEDSQFMIPRLNWSEDIKTKKRR